MRMRAIALHIFVGWVAVTAAAVSAGLLASADEVVRIELNDNLPVANQPSEPRVQPDKPAPSSATSTSPPSSPARLQEALPFALLTTTWWAGDLTCDRDVYRMTLEMEPGERTIAVLRVRKARDPLGRRAEYRLRVTRDPASSLLLFGRGGGNWEWPDGYPDFISLRGTLLEAERRLEGLAVTDRDDSCGTFAAAPSSQEAALAAVSMNDTLPRDPNAPPSRAIVRFNRN